MSESRERRGWQGDIVDSGIWPVAPDWRELREGGVVEG